MKPLLSIGIIFKNEMRCLERCVKSLQPLRDAVPCELVMADTGSDDGSRDVAAKYADILFDFPWIDDFAAARNAVIDCCCGEWYLSIDADEWLDANITQLVSFLTHRDQWIHPLCGLMLRDYFTPELDEHNDFLALRMALLSTGIRYEGTIHEHWNLPYPVYGLGHTLLHHDGYVDHTPNWNKEKHERNMKPLREELAKNPDDLRTLLQCIESSGGNPSYGNYIWQAVTALKRKPEHTKYYGAPLLRYAVLWAAGQHLPELKEWADWLFSDFPDSPYTNIDGAYTLFTHYIEEQDYARAIPKGELYLRTMEDYRAGRTDYTALIFSSFAMAVRSRENAARAILADAYFHEGQPDKAREMLLTIDRAKMRPETVQNYIGIMMNIHAKGEVDMSPILADFWEQTERPEPRKKQGEACRKAMVAAGATAFAQDYRNAEDESGSRHAYTLFLPLAEKNGLGIAAAILETGDRQEMERLLRTVDNWEELPAAALERALLAGVVFPLPDRPLTLEEMDGLAARLAQNRSYLPEFLDKAVQTLDEEPQSLAWARGLALAALLSEDWEADGDGVAAIRRFAAIERAFLSRYYAPAMLCGENICLLPPMHRFGWYCARAFDALDAGDAAGYVRLLREGLTQCESMKPAVEFLLKQLEESRKVQATPELLRLAEQVRTLLFMYPADDPAVKALKQSDAYQKVAHLIEGPDLGVLGGLPQ